MTVERDISLNFILILIACNAAVAGVHAAANIPAVVAIMFMYPSAVAVDSA
jgi:hypothetical protein